MTFKTIYERTCDRCGHKEERDGSLPGNSGWYRLRKLMDDADTLDLCQACVRSRLGKIIDGKFIRTADGES